MPRVKPKPVPQVPMVSRDAALSEIRAALLNMTDAETSMCKAAAEHGIFCHGFDRFTGNELRRRYGWIVRKRPGMSREELEQIANDWQLAQQEVHQEPLACDVQTKVHDTCCGWDDFSNDEIAGFYRELTGREVRVS